MKLTKKVHSVLSRIERKKDIPGKLDMALKYAEDMRYVQFLGIDKGYILSELGKLRLQEYRKIVNAQHN